MFFINPAKSHGKHVYFIINIFITLTVINQGIVMAEDIMIGPGRYIVERIYTCENADKYPLQFNIYKHKINRTHDVYDASMDLTVALDDNIAVLGESFKLVDGGYKPYYKTHFKCGCCFMKQYGEENFKRLLNMAAIDPPDCPVPKGKYNVTNFIFDNSELPDEGVYGEFKVKCTFKTLLNEELACIMMNVNFLEDE